MSYDPVAALYASQKALRAIKRELDHSAQNDDMMRRAYRASRATMHAARNATMEDRRAASRLDMRKAHSS